MIDLGWLIVLVPFLGLSLGAAVLAWYHEAEDDDGMNPFVAAVLAFVVTQIALWILAFGLLNEG
jgi:hypothetical protein